jgi:crotonobetainyl-CoA:carnitine CoA-transferase CaiB-like acyl-CoA transferase
VNESRGALAGVRVIDLTQAIAGPHCTALLAGLGADVLKIERPPAGDPARQAPSRFAALNGGKQSLVLDLRTQAAVVLDMLGEADVLVENYRPGTLARLGLDPARLLERFPRLVITSVSNFGQTGPYRDFEATEAVLVALGGLMALCGEPDRPPLKSGAALAQYAAGSLAAVGTLVALTGVRAGLPGQHVDLSIMEAVMECLEHTIISCTHRHRVRRRMGSRHPDNHPMTIWPARDGYVGASVGFGQWDLLCAMMEHPELADDEALLMGPNRRARADEIDAIFTPWCRERSAVEIVETAQLYRLPFGYVLSPRGLLEDTHLRERGFFGQVAQPDGTTVTLPGPPFRLAATPMTSAAAPLLGDHAEPAFAERAPRTVGKIQTARRLPLDGIRVLDLTHQWAGPFAARILADYGADVIKIESLGRVDSVRYAAMPNDEPGARPWNRGGYFHKQNRNKRSLTLDLAQAQGKEVFLRLAAMSDVVLDNYAARVMPQLGLDYASLKDRFPHLIMANMPGYGSGGPYDHWVAFGTSIEGMSGISSVTGYVGGPPMRIGVALPDAVAGTSAALAILAALEARRRSGVGQHVEVAQREAAITYLAEFIVDAGRGAEDPPRMGNRDPDYVPQGVYPCLGDDTWVALSARNASDWQRLLGVLGHNEQAELHDREARRAHADEIDAWISDWTSRRTPRDAMFELQRAGIPAGAVLTNADLLSDPHLAAREFFVTVDHPDTGPFPYIGFPFKLSCTPPIVQRPAPSLGEHNREILQGLLDLSDAELTELTAAGIIGDRPKGI